MQAFSRPQQLCTEHPWDPITSDTTRLYAPYNSIQQQKEREYYRKKKLESHRKIERKRKQGKWAEKNAMGETNRVGQRGEQGGK